MLKHAQTPNDLSLDAQWEIQKGWHKAMRRGGPHTQETKENC